MKQQDECNKSQKGKGLKSESSYWCSTLNTTLPPGRNTRDLLRPQQDDVSSTQGCKLTTPGLQSLKPHLHADANSHRLMAMTVFCFFVTSNFEVVLAKPGGFPVLPQATKHSLQAELMRQHNYVKRRLHSGSVSFYTHSSALCVPRTDSCHTPPTIGIRQFQEACRLLRLTPNDATCPQPEPCQPLNCPS